MKVNMISAALAMLSACTVFGGEQLLNIPPCAKGKSRFVVPKDRVWPEKPGEGDICLWKDDRFAACAITIDDNCFPLTVKVRLPDGWKTVKGGRFLEHDGKPYALVDVVPDKGAVVLTR